jgi:hypothetical protein
MMQYTALQDYACRLAHQDHQDRLGAAGRRVDAEPRRPSTVGMDPRPAVSMRHVVRLLARLVTRAVPPIA